VEGESVGCGRKDSETKVVAGVSVDLDRLRGPTFLAQTSKTGRCEIKKGLAGFLLTPLFNPVFSPYRCDA
jgi:hypothetical protein